MPNHTRGGKSTQAGDREVRPMLDPFTAVMSLENDTKRAKFEARGKDFDQNV